MMRCWSERERRPDADADADAALPLVAASEGCMTILNTDSRSFIPVRQNKSGEEFICLFGVFDGHNGNTCSKFLSTNFPETLKKNGYLNESPSMALIQSFLELDKTFLKRCCTSGDKSGSTGVTTLIKDEQIFIANTGDSRCIICEDAVVYALTNDHKPSIRRWCNRNYRYDIIWI